MWLSGENGQHKLKRSTSCWKASLYPVVTPPSAWLDPAEEQCREWLHSPKSTVRSPQGGQGNWLDLRGGDSLVLKKTKGGRQFGKQNDLETTFLLISERSLEGKCTQNNILLCLGVEDQPGPGSPTAWASFQACSSPTGCWAMWPWTGLWGQGAWPIAHGWETALSLETLPSGL